MSTSKISLTEGQLISNIEAEEYIQEKLGYNSDPRPVKFEDGDIVEILLVDIHVNKDEDTVILETAGEYDNIIGPIPDGTNQDNIIQKICELKDVEYHYIAELKQEYIPVKNISGCIEPDDKSIDESENNSSSESSSEEYIYSVVVFGFIFAFFFVIFIFVVSATPATYDASATMSGTSGIVESISSKAVTVDKMRISVDFTESLDSASYILVLDDSGNRVKIINKVTGMDQIAFEIPDDDGSYQLVINGEDHVVTRETFTVSIHRHGEKVLWKVIGAALLVSLLFTLIVTLDVENTID